MIEGLHNHNMEHEINNLTLQQTDRPTSPGPYHMCNCPQFIKDCNEATCLRCKPNLHNHSPDKYPRKCSCNFPIHHNTPQGHSTSNTYETNNYTEPHLQLSVSANKPDHMAELLEATKKMAKYFKKSIKHMPNYNKNNDHYQNKANSSHADKHKHKTYHCKDEVNEIISDAYNHKTHHHKLITHQITLM